MEHANLDLVWYVSYGSNLVYERFMCYIRGGKFGQSRAALPGCDDTTPPQATRALTLPYQLYFGGMSPKWHGGVAFINPDTTGYVLARAYLITKQQFVQIVAQESGSPANQALQSALPAGSALMGNGMYDRIVSCGELEGRPLLTFTSPTSHAEYSPPLPAYLQVVGLGLCESHDLTLENAATYLTSQPGIAGEYSRKVVLQLLADATEDSAPRPLTNSLQLPIIP